MIGFSKYRFDKESGERKKQVHSCPPEAGEMEQGRSEPVMPGECGAT
jgi:hypothetical protein